jgi:predicted metal-dependent TIM-barrel fold hydrolase
LVPRQIGPPHKDHYLSAGGTRALVKALEVCGVGATMIPDNWASVLQKLKEIQFKNRQIQLGRQFQLTTATPAEFEMALLYVGDITVVAN